MTTTTGRGIAALSALVLSAAMADASALTGEELLARCEAGSDWYSRGLCGGYVAGLDRGYRLGRTWGAMQVLHGERLEDWIRAGEPREGLEDEIDRLERTIQTYCLPDGLTGGELVGAVVDFLRDNPAIRHGEAELLVPAALARRWPCE